MAVLHNALDRFSLRDLLLIAVMAALGVALKPIIVPLAHLVSAPLLIPGGALAGGLYMMWLVVAMGLTQKRGTATLVGLVQALLVTVTGIVGSHGLMSLFSYTLPGVILDLLLLLIGHRVCCRYCTFIAGMAANIAGAVCVNLIFFRLPLIPLLLSLAVAAFSGGLGGLLAWELLQALKKYHIGFHGGAKQE
ncbi:MAG: ECF transporter S component [Bacillota bacterium]|nr:ECF transporter S component [Bacillota bacterium]